MTTHNKATSETRFLTVLFVLKLYIHKYAQSNVFKSYLKLFFSLSDYGYSFETKLRSLLFCSVTGPVFPLKT